MSPLALAFLSKQFASLLMSWHCQNQVVLNEDWNTLLTYGKADSALFAITRVRDERRADSSHYATYETTSRSLTKDQDWESLADVRKSVVAHIRRLTSLFSTGSMRGNDRTIMFPYYSSELQATLPNCPAAVVSLPKSGSAGTSTCPSPESSTGTYIPLSRPCGTDGPVRAHRHHRLVFLSIK